jgi:uncharacterized protein (TIGR02757 family)
MNKLRKFLDAKADLYNQPSFINDDPVSVPHLFTQKQDIEIAGLFAAVFAWGNRTTIINKSRELLSRMDNAPHEFILQHSAADLRKLKGFVHRTFNSDDLYGFIDFLHRHYSKQDTLEKAFFPGKNVSVEEGLNHFKKEFFSGEHLKRTEKHIPSPAQKSACKRLNMFLRWMVRDDRKGVDFGLWKTIRPSQLICPVDVHVGRVARKLGLITRKQTDWQTAVELTEALRKLDRQDPVKYDFALFNLGVLEKF